VLIFRNVHHLTPVFFFLDKKTDYINKVLFCNSFAGRNDQLQREITVLRERNKNEIATLKKSLDDAIGRWYDNLRFFNTIE